jgi:hypothetical protein
MTVRHGAAGVVLVRSRMPGVPPARSGSWRAPVAFAAAAAALAVCSALLLTGASIAARAVQGQCPLRTSIAAYAGGHRLLIRAEPVRGATALLHLCAERAAWPVRSWSVHIGGSGRGAAGAVAVQQVAEGVALAAVPLTRGLPTGIDVTLISRSGPLLTFTAEVTAG